MNKRALIIVCLSVLPLLIGNIVYAQTPVTIRFATYGLLEKATESYFRNVVTAFERENPDIKVEILSFPYLDLKQQVLIRCTAGDAPDIVHGETAALSTYINSGFLAPLDNLLSEDYIKDIYPAVRESVSSEGKMYAVPWNCSPYVLVYNKELFRKAGLDPNEPPGTYKELMEYAERISQLKDENGNAIYGIGLTTASVPISGNAILSTMFSFGGGIYDKHGSLDINNRGNVEAFRFYKTLFQKGLNPETAKLKDLRNLMAIGRLGMYTDQIWGTSGVYNINPEIKDKLALAPLPSTDVTNGLSILESMQLLVMKDSKHKKEAIRFVEYLTSKDALIEYFRYMPFLAGRRSINECDEFTDDFIRPVKDTLYNVKALERQHPNMENALLELTTAAQKVTIGGESPETVAAELEKKLEYVLK